MRKLEQKRDMFQGCGPPTPPTARSIPNYQRNEINLSCWMQCAVRHRMKSLKLRVEA